jgi:hypothetical protein
MIVMPGLVPGIHALFSVGTKNVDGRDKPGHDDAPSPWFRAWLTTPRRLQTLCNYVDIQH